LASAQDIENRIPITGALMLATLMNTLDSTIANVALPHIQGSVSAAQDEITWVLTSYIIATAIMTPLSGWISQKIGLKRMLLISIGGFTLASMLCGIATSLPEIVAYRLLQGVAGASLMPLSQTVMLNLYPQRLMPRVMSIWSAAVILGPIVGPTLGGWITEDLTWRWVFYINLPVGILAFLGVYIFMGHDAGGRQRPFDFLGFGALVTFVLGFQIMLDRGPSQDWFSSIEIWVEGILAVMGLWVFVIQTATAKDPFFHRDLAKDGNFVGTTIFGFFVGALLFSTSALLPSFMQNLMGYSAMQSGITSMPRGVGSLISFLSIPFLLRKVGAKPTLFAGVVLNVVSTWQMGRFDLSMTSEPIMVASFIQGVGTGLMFAPLNTLAYASLDPHHRTEGTIVSTMARSLGSSVGISVVQAALIRDAALGHVRLSERLDLANPVLRSALPPFMNPGSDGGLQVLNGEVTRQGTMLSYEAVFSWMALSIILLIPLILFLKSAPAVTGGPQEAHAD
jgi:DHA2 family multidrug resistance protein